METTSSLLSASVVERIGWTLMHSIWQIAMLALRSPRAAHSRRPVSSGPPRANAK